MVPKAGGMLYMDAVLDGGIDSPERNLERSDFSIVAQIFLNLT